MPVPGEYEHSSFKNLGPSAVPRPPTCTFSNTAPAIFIKSQHFIKTISRNTTAQAVSSGI
jgi:hypothetical protein